MKKYALISLILNMIIVKKKLCVLPCNLSFTKIKYRLNSRYSKGREEYKKKSGQNGLQLLNNYVIEFFFVFFIASLLFNFYNCYQ